MFYRGCGAATLLTYLKESCLPLHQLTRRLNERSCPSELCGIWISFSEDTWTRQVGCPSLISHRLSRIWRGEALIKTERDIMQRTIESLTAAGRDAFSRDDFVDARARHLTDQNVPLINGYFVGGGMNGWRRACLQLLRKLWTKACKTTKKAGAPGDLFVAECKKDDMCRRVPGAR